MEKKIYPLLKCSHCGKEFKHQNTRQFKQTVVYCGKDCQYGAVMNRKTIICACGCGRSRDVAISKFEGGAMFFSRECADKMRRKRVSFECACGCGRTRELCPHEIKSGKGRFFNAQCKEEFYAKKNLEKQRSLEIKSQEKVIRRPTKDVFERLNNDKTLISGANNLADLIGCHPNQIRTLVRHDCYKFPKAYESVGSGNAYRNYYKLADVIAYKAVYEQLKSDGAVQEYSGIDAAPAPDSLSILAIRFIGGNPKALPRTAKSAYTDSYNKPEETPKKDTSLGDAWARMNKKLSEDGRKWTQ